MRKRILTALTMFLSGLGVLSPQHASAIIVSEPGTSAPVQKKPVQRKPAPPPPAPVVIHNWDAVAYCESTNNWQAATGNGFYGGLQFTINTWRAFGGVGMPQFATRIQQIIVAERVLAAQGPGAWPVCGRYLTLPAS